MYDPLPKDWPLFSKAIKRTTLAIGTGSFSLWDDAGNLLFNAGAGISGAAGCDEPGYWDVNAVLADGNEKRRPPDSRCTPKPVCAETTETPAATKIIARITPNGGVNGSLMFIFSAK